MSKRKIDDSTVHLEQRAAIKFCFKLGKTSQQTIEMMGMAGDAHNVSRALVYKWHRRFREGRESIQDDERSGRPRKIDDKVTQSIQDAVTGDGRVTIRDIAELVDCLISTVHTILTTTLNMERVCARWVPRTLTEEQMKKRVIASNKFLRRWRKEGDAFLKRIITVDETWLYYFDPETKQQSSVWIQNGNPPPKKAKVTRSVGKHMFIVFMDMDGIIPSHAVPVGQTVNAEYYCKVIRRDLVYALQKKRPEIASNMETVIFHQDNAPAHTAACTSIELDLLGFERLEHPPYSPDLAPMDFAVFPYLKCCLRGKHYDNFIDLKMAALSTIKCMDKSWFHSVYQKWVCRHQKWLDWKGIYFEKE